MRLKSAGAILFLFLTLGCGGSGGGIVSRHTVIVPSDMEFSTYFDQATIVFHVGTFDATTTVTLVEAPPPRFSDPHFHAIRRTLTFSASAQAHAFDVWYPDIGSYPQLSAIALNGSQVVATLPLVRQNSQVGIHIDPAAIPPGSGPLQVTLCVGEVTN